MANQWGIDEEDPNRFLPQPANPYAGMSDNYGGGNDFSSANVQRYNDADIPVAYVQAATPPSNTWGIADSANSNGVSPTPYLGTTGGYDPRDNQTGNYDSRAVTDYNRNAALRGERNTTSGNMSGSGGLSGGSSSGGSGGVPQQKDYRTQAEYERAYYASKDANDPRGKAPATQAASGGQPRASGGGGQPQQYGQSQSQGGQPQQSYRPPANWDEEAYLRANPDVAAAVRAGTQKSGYDHFANYGVKEGRTMTAAQQAQQPQVDPRIARAEEAAKQAQAQMQAMQQAQQQQREAKARSDAQNQILSARVVGTGAGGEQIVRFTEGTPRGYTPDFAALAQSTGLGAASLMRAWRDQGGQLDGEIMPISGGRSGGNAPSVAAPTMPTLPAPTQPVAPTLPLDRYGLSPETMPTTSPVAGGFDPRIVTPDQNVDMVVNANPLGTASTIAQPVATTGADKYLTPEQRAGNMVAPGSVPTTNPWGLQEQPQVVPQITTGTNYTNNGSTDRWEFDPIQGVWVNGRGETRPYEDNPNARP